MTATGAVQPITLERLRTACSTCGLKEICLPVGLSDPEMRKLDDLVYVRRTARKGHSIYRSGEPFTSLYAVRSGFFKTTVLSDDGRDQVTGFHMGGELMGMDGISTESHTCDAVALEDSEVCVIPFGRLEDLSREVPALQSHFHKVMSREIVRDHSVMMLLGSMRAEERVAAFLVNLSQRFLARGYSPSEFYLRMTREEIGSYLGLKLETVSRIFSRFQDEGLVGVQQKHIRITDPARLKQLVAQRPC
ncbi:MAG: fumarate/nitrate reduction transcriptional regulator Fnr [Betaproteobacteria bacterium]|jgi:CRP/FNR family transcriptional regulator